MNKERKGKNLLQKTLWRAEVIYEHTSNLLNSKRSERGSVRERGLGVHRHPNNVPNMILYPPEDWNGWL